MSKTIRIEIASSQDRNSGLNVKRLSGWTVPCAAEYGANRGGLVYFEGDIEDRRIDAEYGLIALFAHVGSAKSQQGGLLVECEDIYNSVFAVPNDRLKRRKKQAVCAKILIAYMAIRFILESLRAGLLAVSQV